MEIILADFFAVFVVIEGTFSYHKLISVLVVRIHEKCKKSYDNSEQPTDIRQSIINFTNSSTNINHPPIHNKFVSDIRIGAKIINLIRRILKFINKISSDHLLIHPGKHTVISSYLKTTKLCNILYPTLICECYTIVIVYEVAYRSLSGRIYYCV